MTPLDRHAMALCQAVHTAVGGRPIRWVDLHRIRLQLGIGIDDVETIARHAASRNWLVLNRGPILHSVSLGSTLLEAVAGKFSRTTNNH